MRDERARLEKAYKNSIFGSWSCSFSIRAPRHCLELRLDGGDTLHEFVNAVVTTRSAQPVLSALVRGRPQHRVCAPHVATSLDDAVAGLPLTGRKWTVAEKARASLAETLGYCVVRCSRYEGAIFTLPVRSRQSTGDTDHANFVFVDLRRAPAKVYLFEPNGPRFHTDAASRLEHALRLLEQLLPGRVDPRFDAPGSRGLQLLLGVAPSAGRMESFAICGAVTHWLIHKFVTFDGPALSFPDFVDALEAAVEREPARARDAIVAFMGAVTNAMEGGRYAAGLRENVERDLARMEPVACPRQGACGGDHRVVVEVSASIGPVQAGPLRIGVHDLCGGGATFGRAARLVQDLDAGSRSKKKHTKTKKKRLSRAEELAEHEAVGRVRSAVRDFLRGATAPNSQLAVGKSVEFHGDVPFAFDVIVTRDVPKDAPDEIVVFEFDPGEKAAASFVRVIDMWKARADASRRFFLEVSEALMADAP